jgi:hypothetical protein
MNPFAQDEGKELVDKTKLNVLLKLFDRNDWLLFNISFNIMSMPLDFLFFNIVPIYKSGLKDDPTNYRGITIGSALGKLFAKILNTRLENFLFKRNIILYQKPFSSQ